jgi:death-on-curing protein
MIRRIAYEDILAIHEMQIVNHGGLPGVRDEGLLDAALAQPFATFDQIDLYPSILDMECGSLPYRVMMKPHGLSGWRLNHDR